MQSSASQETKPVVRTRVVKIVVYVNCAALIIGGFISFLLNILNFLNPTLPVLSIYMCIFGLMALAGELNLSIASRYFGFLHDWIGESVFFIFVGTLGISFGTSGLVGFIIGIFSCVVGVMCILDHFVFTRHIAFGNANAPAGVASSVEPGA